MKRNRALISVFGMMTQKKVLPIELARFRPGELFPLLCRGQNQERRAQWDGLSAVFTNTLLMDEDAISRYRGLWRIEDCFRLTKSNLIVRPIFHFKPKRILGQVALCFMSLVIPITEINVR